MADMDDVLEPASEFGSVLKDGERRTVTVLFSDMKGFTALSEKSDPEEMDQLMGRVFTRFEAIIRRHGGSVEKYIGDALVAVFGAAELHEDDPARAIDCALEFIAALRRPSGGLPEGGPDVGPSGLSFRTGIHTGLVTTGRRGEFGVVTGHTLAVASRLQVAAPVNGILVSGSTREACAKQFVFSDPQELTLKGKEERVLAWQALSRRKAIFDYDTPFIDRKQPLETLTGEYIKHMRGQYGGVYVLGDGGIGKTRLVAEFWARLKGFPDFQATFLTINPSLCGTFEYAAALNAVTDFLDIKPDASFEEYSGALANRVDLADEARRDCWGLFSPADRPTADSRFLGALGSLFDAILASDGDAYPDVVFVDNARLMDAKSLEFFRGYRGSARSRPFVVLCDRARAAAAAVVFDVQVELALEPLGHDDSLALARALDSGGLDEASLELIVERAQGYPLFIEEYVKLARQDGNIGHLPESIQTTILAALERLDTVGRDMARRLSILRYPFEQAMALALHGKGENDACPDLECCADMSACLDRLVDERILARAGDGRWAFKHTIVREAILSSLLLRNRRILHALAAEHLRGEGQDRPAELFYHLAESESWQAARDYLVEERPHLPLESLGHIQKLIDHCPQSKLGELIELHFIKYATNYNNKVYEGLAPIVHAMYHLALRARKPFYLARCYHLLMTTYYMSLDYRSAILYGSKALDAYEGAGNRRAAANARFFLALCFLAIGRFDRARSALDGLPLDDEYAAGLAATALADYHRLKGNHREACSAFQALLKQAQQRGDADMVYQYRAKLVSASLRNFQFDEPLAVDAVERAYCGLDGQANCLYHAALALAWRLAGNSAEAAKSFASAEYHLAQLRGDEERAGAAAELGWARLLAGDRQEARERYVDGLEASLRSRHYAAMFECQISLAEICLLDGETDGFGFFVADACQLAAAPIYRERKTEARYYYFAWLLMECSPEGYSCGDYLRQDERDEYIAEAKRLLDDELLACRDDAVRERLLGLSVFGRIARA
ncbi:MAG: hypothetical protein A2087_04020 [Spirochaetes bacterium GWD1_61_31]|nr:MAG: hypothetical protein A2Y37_12605 [Spirochaetes bacterium GWB1_60_80]OHD32949.1 MAG: hypothetical protein A2004_01100 [Spirochaetes bacterium GWC1_61_12]OHD44196.1 MAG: hypothetical protein A2087_04020 [Spirochaetes bacterium GWD1_61_31]OHD58786.1 MAG: hypothetical protein A2Y32_01180 [Spirochaetes bacterium GWF1_60_12]HAP42705.1 hypothetical protein [Spirochaetaceae bacterium]